MDYFEYERRQRLKKLNGEKVEIYERLSFVGVLKRIALYRLCDLTVFAAYALFQFYVGGYLHTLLEEARIGIVHYSFCCMLLFPIPFYLIFSKCTVQIDPLDPCFQGNRLDLFRFCRIYTCHIGKHDLIIHTLFLSFMALLPAIPREHLFDLSLGFGFRYFYDVGLSDGAAYLLSLLHFLLCYYLGLSLAGKAYLRTRLFQKGKFHTRTEQAEEGEEQSPLRGFRLVVHTAVRYLVKNVFCVFAVCASMLAMQYADIEESVLAGYFRLIILAALYFVTASAFITNNKPLRDGILSGTPLFHRPDFWVDAVLLAAVAWLFPFGFLGNRVLRLSFWWIPQEDRIAGLRMALFLFGVAADAILLLRARRKLSMPTMAKIPGGKDREWLKILLRLVITAVLIVLSIPILLFLCLFEEFPAIPIVIASYLIIGRIVGFLRRVHKRHKFLDQLRRVCSEKGYTLSRIHRPYLSLLLYDDKLSFTVSANGKIYPCKLLSGIRKRHSMMFGEDGFYAYHKEVKFRDMIFYSHDTVRDYSFSAEGDKYLILTYVPTKVLMAGTNEYKNDVGAQMYGGYAMFRIWAPAAALPNIKMESNDGQELDTGDSVDEEYRLFSALGFLGSLERGCLDRKAKS